jgi:hypothetical protein
VIVFDLRCDGGHVFEAWFASGQAYADQQAAGLVSCPVCASTAVDKAVMAPAVAAKGNRRADPPAPAAAVKAALAAIAAEQARQLPSSTWVGTAFAGRARAMHDGEEPPAPIHGQASADEARALVADGVPIAPLLVPVVPPERRN